MTRPSPLAAESSDRKSYSDGGLVSQNAGLPPATLFLMIDSLQTGGSERQFVALNRSLSESRFRTKLACIQAKGGFQDGLSLDSYPLGGSLYGVQSWRTRLKLCRTLRRDRTAIAHAFDFYTNLTLVPCARLAGVPVVIGSQRQLGDLLTPIQSRAQMMMFRLCDAVVCNSSAAAKRLIDEGLPESRITVIWNGLAPEDFAAATPAFLPRPGWRRVGMVARMNSRAKNHSIFLRVAARLAADDSKVEFVMVGDGPLRPELESQAADLGLGERVRFLGDRRDVLAILSSVDLTVLPSASKSLSNAIIESMAAGVPVVATNIGSNFELVTKERGALVALGDEEALAREIARILREDVLRVQMGENSRRFAQQNFTLKEMGRRYEQLYTELLARKGWRPCFDAGHQAE